MTIDSVTQPANGTVVITGGGTGLTYQPDAELLQRPARHHPGHVHLHPQPGGSTATVSVTVTCVATTRPPSTTPPPWPRTRAPTAIDVLANDTDLDGGPIIDRLGDPAGQRHGRDHRRRHRAHLPARTPNYCNDPPGTTPDTFTYTLDPGGSTATVVGHRHLRRRPAGGRRRHRHRAPRTPRRPRSTCWPTTPTSTAAR